ncbi:uncharacterized protein GGS22DRAFT_176343 [Annulohypoxylon maeteangense]|uniref:uncharacterized protein n=1 Tax=Annulohypoxylon maeteangense TaxID=1927788 RepID=UPI002007F685|nr:uncharacterized protein GGS22DRAFT_176343 [Annulohypoxylon maeteangense]KAI0879917.1 hypothetical protein GGS22DRAFT_176343 [Annulohypoxylon maeteangense]
MALMFPSLSLLRLFVSAICLGCFECFSLYPNWSFRFYDRHTVAALRLLVFSLVLSTISFQMSLVLLMRFMLLFGSQSRCRCLFISHSVSDEPGQMDR